MIDEGGCSFPLHGIDGVIDYGMSKRDYFAAAVVAGGFAKESVPEYDLIAMFGRNRTGIRREEIIAADAYRIADAMIARARRPQENGS